MSIFQEFMEDFKHPWALVGVIGQILFFSRFFVQWIVSEKKGKSTIPVVFWYLSLGGGAMLMTYAICQRDLVITLGQGVGLFVYIRNLMLISKAKRRKTEERAAQ